MISVSMRPSLLSMPHKANKKVVGAIFDCKPVDSF
jgi:hypothetical protein